MTVSNAQNMIENIQNATIAKLKKIVKEINGDVSLYTLKDDNGIALLEHLVTRISKFGPNSVMDIFMLIPVDVIKDNILNTQGKANILERILSKETPYEYVVFRVLHLLDLSDEKIFKSNGVQKLLTSSKLCGGFGNAVVLTGYAIDANSLEKYVTDRGVSSVIKLLSKKLESTNVEANILLAKKIRDTSMFNNIFSLGDVGRNSYIRSEDFQTMIKYMDDVVKKDELSVDFSLLPFKKLEFDSKKPLKVKSYVLDDLISRVFHICKDQPNNDKNKDEMKVVFDFFTFLKDKGFCSGVVSTLAVYGDVNVPVEYGVLKKFVDDKLNKVFQEIEYDIYDYVQKNGKLAYQKSDGSDILSVDKLLENNWVSLTDRQKSLLKVLENKLNKSPITIEVDSLINRNKVDVAADVVKSINKKFIKVFGRDEDSVKLSGIEALAKLTGVGIGNVKEIIKGLNELGNFNIPDNFEYNLGVSIVSSTGLASKVLDYLNKNKFFDELTEGVNGALKGVVYKDYTLAHQKVRDNIASITASYKDLNVNIEEYKARLDNFKEVGDFVVYKEQGFKDVFGELTGGYTSMTIPNEGLYDVSLNKAELIKNIKLLHGKLNVAAQHLASLGHSVETSQIIKEAFNKLKGVSLENSEKFELLNGFIKTANLESSINEGSLYCINNRDNVLYNSLKDVYIKNENNIKNKKSPKVR